MPNSLRNKIKHLYYKGELNERERDRILNALDDADRIKTELEPCEDCINREEVIKHLENITMDTNPDHYGSKDKWYQANGFNLCKVGIELYVKNLPLVTPKPKTGHWEDCSNGWMCSNCYKDVSHESDFCPNCGADMRGEDNAK